jgi:hypothetical protein
MKQARSSVGVTSSNRPSDLLAWPTRALFDDASEIQKSVAQFIDD